MTRSFSWQHDPGSTQIPNPGYGIEDYNPPPPRCMTLGPLLNESLRTRHCFTSQLRKILLDMTHLSALETSSGRSAAWIRWIVLSTMLTLAFLHVEMENSTIFRRSRKSRFIDRLVPCTQMVGNHLTPLTWFSVIFFKKMLINFYFNKIRIKNTYKTKSISIRTHHDAFSSYVYHQRLLIVVAQSTSYRRAFFRPTSTMLHHHTLTTPHHTTTLSTSIFAACNTTGSHNHPCRSGGGVGHKGCRQQG